MVTVAETNATNYPLGYYYVTADHSTKINDFKWTSGDKETVLITQFIRGWLGKNRVFCLDLAESDADARGMEFSNWAEFVHGESIRKLPPFKTKFQPPSSPLTSINLVAKEELVRRKVNNITLGVQNLILFKLVEDYYYRGKTIDFVSDIVADHLDRLWEPLYASQVAANNFDNWQFRRKHGTSTTTN